ncbi:MAG: phosphoenolpyruvate carboxykinase [ATP] 2 [Chitinophagales bacterium]|nr:MAG: phosphoenolpyruvate carboxykinase [ATP] 2 [Chitinophagales bacterium]
MTIHGLKSNVAGLEAELKNPANIYWNLTPAELVEHAITGNMGVLNDTGALVVDTGEFTGRSPKDKFIVKDALTANSVDWNNFNIPFSEEHFNRLLEDMKVYSQDKNIYVRDAYVCADPKYRMNLRVITEFPWANLFSYNMFLRPSAAEIQDMQPEWTILALPSFHAHAGRHGTRQHNFAVINFTRKIALIGGTAYTGEIKKGVFTVLNFVLPHQHGVLSMHCSANMGPQGDTALFFGLSGTGKTTLSADSGRRLIGDDEHGWSDEGIFNFEGGCYAKCIDLTPEKEPQIFAAIRFGSLLENVRFFKNSRTVDYSDKSVTENTRVSYPLHYIDNALIPSVGNIPKNIFFLTADAFGVLPPISKLTPGQAMFHFISGYTAKVAGTEAGIIEPQPSFSACFGAPFLPLHPTRYAEMLGIKMQKYQVKTWLINTGWSGGPYGIGSRIKLAYTRAMITAALNGQLENVPYETHPVFGLHMPQSCPNVPSEILNPRNTWDNKANYDKQANMLAEKFNRNFEKYADKATEDILHAAPKSTARV